MKLSIAILGATGAVGGEVLKSLLHSNQVNKLTLLGRRPVEGLKQDFVNQVKVDILETSSYAKVLQGHNIAICTLGVGQPSKVSKEDFLKIDKVAVLDFAKSCKKQGVKHFQLLSSVGADSSSRSFYLRSKGELIDALKGLDFNRLSIFQPSMILTPKNRYGMMQALTLKVWPIISPILVGQLKPYKGINVETLGTAMALNSFTISDGIEYLSWENFINLSPHD